VSGREEGVQEGRVQGKAGEHKGEQENGSGRVGEGEGGRAQEGERKCVCEERVSVRAGEC